MIKSASRIYLLSLLLLAPGQIFAGPQQVPEQTPVLQVVTTLPDYAVLARAIGGDRVAVQAIVLGDQDAHFIRPKPSFVHIVRRADVLIATGLDLEVWLPTVVDKSGNRRVRSGSPGYVAVAQGMKLLDVPQVLSRSEGGVHIHGNPHVTCSPLNMRAAARNIATGLSTNDPAGREFYQANLEIFLQELDVRIYGAELTGLLGGENLGRMAEKGTLISFLETQEFQGRPLIQLLGGWLGRMMPVRGMSIVTYHKNWIYFVNLFGLQNVGTVEPKPGISPTPRHVTELVEMMEERNIRLILAANYFDEQKIRTVAGRVGAIPVIVPLYVGGAPGIETYFDLVDAWVEGLLDAAARSGSLGDVPATRSAVQGG